MKDKVSRRSLLKAAGGAALSGVGARALGSQGPVGTLRASENLAVKKHVLRVAHLTDIHVQPELRAFEGMEKALKHAQERKPDLLIYGGDQHMDMLAVDLDRVKLQAELFKKVHKANTSLPTHYCFGNHDVWGWGARDKFKNEPLFGKQFSQDFWEYEKPYYSFDKAGWHFVILDSIRPVEGNGYSAGLDLEQFEWLTDDLDKTPKATPVIIVSHIPIAAICTVLATDNFKDDSTRISKSIQHVDAHKLKQLFVKHPNVKLCLSGHIHLQDRVEYLGVTYVCNGAVSGGWWTGNNQEFAPAYAMVDLFDDGTFESKMVEYGWVARS